MATTTCTTATTTYTATTNIFLNFKASTNISHNYNNSNNNSYSNDCDSGDKKKQIFTKYVITVMMILIIIVLIIILKSNQEQNLRHVGFDSPQGTSWVLEWLFNHGLHSRHQIKLERKRKGTEPPFVCHLLTTKRRTSSLETVTVLNEIQEQGVEETFCIILQGII